ncbi:hypothetical protein ABMA27_016839 [Loxostege sticticalis]|uniref:Multiple inositol polyphosphate phosphatase 1 n=2 Tax=Loxostege sticticalis TaxID=481309 RepID=A0ABR3I3S3_LOXSC
MISHTLVLLVLVLANLAVGQSCYWNDACSYQLYSSKTPYDTVRGDIRDYPVPENCKAISLWSLNRHGNRNPGGSVTESMKVIANLKDEIIASHNQGRGELCAQDIEDFKKWNWNSTLEVATSDLTGTGYEELYDIAKRLREKYPHLLEGDKDDFYFRCTNEQRTITSAIAFAHGWSEGTSLALSVDGPWDRDDVIRPYENCDRYQQEVKNGPEVATQVDDYFINPEFVTVKNNVQRRLGLTTQLSSEDIYSLYEICRFYRSWEPTLRSPWCSAFSNEDLVALEYRDDVRHYHRNGYGSWVNVNLGATALKDLYGSFEAALTPQGKNLVAYFTHDTMIEMVLCAMGLYKDDFVLQGRQRDPNRLWRTSHIGSFSANILAVLNECSTGSANRSYRVQIFVNEKVTDLCPLEGCTWQEFQNHFEKFKATNLDFCRMTYQGPEVETPENAELISPESNVPDGASALIVTSWMLMAGLAIHLR